MKRSGLYDNTIIILTSDHGEELGDNGDRWDHCQLLSQEEIWIPLLIKMPGKNKKIIIKDVVQNIDIYPTLVDYLDKWWRPQFYNSLEGKSLMPLVNKKQSDTERYACSFWNEQQSIIKGNYKYWLKGTKEFFVNIKNNEEITDLETNYKLKKLLEKIVNLYITERDYYKTKTESLKAMGYLQ